MTEQVNKWLSQVNTVSWLKDKVNEGLSNISWPTKKSEAWKYTSLRHIEKAGFTFNNVAQEQDIHHSATNIDAELITIPDLDTFNLVFLNGRFSQELSNVDLASNELPQGLSLVDFTQANNEQREFIQASLHNNVKSSSQVFAHLSMAMLDQGLLIDIAPNTHIKKPIQITHFTTHDAHEKGMQHRVLVKAGALVEAVVIELFYSDTSEHMGWMNQVTEIIQDKASHIHHYRLHKEQQAMAHTGSVHVSLERDASFTSFMLGLGGKLKRFEYNVQHLGKGGACNLQGVYLTNRKQHFDLSTKVDHASAHCHTEELFRGVIDDESKAAFSGEIHIHKDAQKSLAEMSNNNLLLSEEATINTKPALEIYADDVSCAHGATISQMDDEAMSYLLRRGISPAEAEVMLRFGFINEVLMGVKHSEIFDYIRPSIVDRFSKDEHLRRLLIDS